MKRGRRGPGNVVVSPDSEVRRFSTQVATALGVDGRFVPRLVAFFSSMRRVPLVWLQLSPTTKSGDAFARCTAPWVGDLVFARLPGDEAGAGDQASAEVDVSRALRECSGNYLCVLEGVPPPGIVKPPMGRVFQFARDVCSQARAVMYVG